MCNYQQRAASSRQWALCEEDKGERERGEAQIPVSGNGKCQSDRNQATGRKLLIGQLAPWVTWGIWHPPPMKRDRSRTSKKKSRRMKASNKSCVNRWSVDTGTGTWRWEEVLFWLHESDGEQWLRCQGGRVTPCVSEASSPPPMNRDRYSRIEKY